MKVAIIIATAPGRDAQASRAREAYLRETPGGVHLVTIESVEPLADAWQGGLAKVVGADVVHFTIDELEPHPGWLPAAASAISADRVPSSILWSADGAELNAGYRMTGSRDWSSAVGSEFPTMSWAQIKSFGCPPISDEQGAQYVVRTGYAFTRHGG